MLRTELFETLKVIKQELVETKQLIEQCSKKKKQTVKETTVEITEQLPRNIDKGSLHKVLGYDEDTNLSEVSKDEMIRRAKDQINSGKVTYKEMIAKLNWQATMNKTNNPEFSKKLRDVMDELRVWWERKKD